MSPALPMPAPPAATALDEVRVNAMLAGIQAQRDAALNQVVHLGGELAIQNANLAAVRKELTALSEDAATLRSQVDDLTATLAQVNLHSSAATQPALAAG